MLHTANFKCVRTGIFSLLFILAMIKASSQVLPDSEAKGIAARTSTKDAYAQPDPISSTVVNSIAVFTPQQKGFTTETAVKSISRSVAEVNISTQYFDGLGRPIQTVIWNASPSPSLKDIVNP